MVAVAEAADGFTILEVVIVMVPFFAGSEAAAAAERCENENRYGLRTLERSVFGFCFGFRWFKSEDGERDVLRGEDEGETTGEAVVVVVVIVEAEIEAEVTDGTAIGTAAELLIITAAAAARKVREIIEKW